MLASVELLHVVLKGAFVHSLFVPRLKNQQGHFVVDGLLYGFSKGFVGVIVRCRAGIPAVLNKRNGVVPVA